MIRTFGATTTFDGTVVALGAADRIRTYDPRITNAVLYRLSYRGSDALYRSTAWVPASRQRLIAAQRGRLNLVLIYG
jgi:hypothetical protein